MGDLRKVPLSDIRENPVALRSVNHDSEGYLGLVASIKEKGFLGAIIVRERTDDESGKKFLELVDGLHRYSAAKDAGVTEINVDVTNLSDDETLEAQILGNIHHVETRPVEYTKQMLRILARNPLMTEADLAKRLGMSITWVSQRLSLTKIGNEKIQKLIDEGKICLLNAYSLAKLPVEEQANFVDRAMTEDAETFVPTVNKRVKELKEAARQGKDAEEAKFEPVAHMQKLKDIKAALDDPSLVTALVGKIKSPIEAAMVALRWALHLDAASVASQQAKYEEKKKAREDKAAARAAEKAEQIAEKKKKEAAEAATAAATAKEALDSVAKK